ncbi:MAG: hypothetical protein Q8P81_03325 [Nanoarchaeota archaeon]|nr:hypothetical protein [Nanoarchaeota archaeon]
MILPSEIRIGDLVYLPSDSVLIRDDVGSYGRYTAPLVILREPSVALVLEAREEICLILLNGIKYITYYKNMFHANNK